MHLNLIDIISVSIIGVAAIVYLARLFYKGRKGQITVCGGCDNNSKCHSKRYPG